jgi:hypothetical protein
VVVEAYSVLTRLPGGLAVPAGMAAGVLARRFADPALRLTARRQAAVLETLAGSGVSGGASYDGLIALEARAHDHVLLSLDTRAQETYRRLGAAFQVVQPARPGP